MLVFILIGAAGMLLLLVSLIVGDLIDLGDGAVSSTSLGVGGVVFGAVGTIVVANGGPVWLAYAVSAVVGILAVLLAQALVRRLTASEDGVSVSLVGVQGTATTDITPTSGEVALDAASELERRLARADEPIPAGARVVVVEHFGSTVRVGPFAPTR
ncbi:NfeD family protein [Isoptericola sp. NEAU-Y5]|uniref:NfeD family protein n=1 Tax=Isoptericola luteus TaxID=2879484 RepID=A0ABS7ZA04_9MICO|nr:NfeD family protein [Isoptericola sp. NEAU-Y5]MCA5891888.1 NfeD family protein [Isoptericola sp. NEAU-Y5]